MKTATIDKLLRRAAAWWAIITVLFFLTFPFWSHALLAVLRFVLEGLSNFGGGY